MSSLAAFLRPTRIKLLFLAEWTFFVAFSAAQGRLRTGHTVAVALYPLAFYYLLGCAMVAWSRRARWIASGWSLVAVGVALAALDQGVKALVAAGLPRGASLPIVPGWLVLDHAFNRHGSWLAGELGPGATGPLVATQWALAGAMLLIVVAGHRRYVARHRRSLWIDAAFLGLFAAEASWICDMTLRGGILDFIGLPGLVAADLKDVFVTLGAVAFVAETLEQPRLFWRWRREPPGSRPIETAPDAKPGDEGEPHVR